MNPTSSPYQAGQEDIAELKEKISAFQDGKLDEEKFKAYRLTRGVYGQRQLGVQMFRTKIPFGKLTAAQLSKIADLSDQYSTGNLHLTTRQNIQLHYVKLTDSPAIWEGLVAVGMDAREACGNTVRNLTASPTAGIDPEEPFDVSPYVYATYQYFLRNPICQDMGRKIKPAFSSSEKDSAFTYFHDFGFIPRIRTVDGEPTRGFKVVIGGGLGAQSIVAHEVYDFLPTDQIIPFMEACIRVFDRYGERSKRFKARMKFLIQKLGLEAFLTLVEEERKALPYASYPIDPETIITEIPQLPADYQSVTPHDTQKYQAWYKMNTFNQKQAGFRAVQLRVQLGDIHSDTARSLAKLITLYAADDIRVTVNQGLLMRFVHEAYLPALFNELDSLGLAEPGFDTLVDVTACPGTDTCNLGVSNSTMLATELESMIREDFEHLLDDAFLKIKISGCMNACGQHMAAQIGLHGSSIKHGKLVVPAMQVVLGGGVDPEGNGFIAERVIKLPSKRIPQAVATLLDDFETNKIENEYFNDYFRRQGKKYFYALLKPFANLDDLIQTDYQDWGKDENFQPEVGVGECAGVAYDVIGGIIQDGAERLSDSISYLEKDEYAHSIYLSYSSFVILAKAMLLAKDIACNTHSAILSDFDTHYVETGEWHLDDIESFKAHVMRINQYAPEKDFAHTYYKDAKSFLSDIQNLRSKQLADEDDKQVINHHYQA